MHAIFAYLHSDHSEVQRNDVFRFSTLCRPKVPDRAFDQDHKHVAWHRATCGQFVWRSWSSELLFTRCRMLLQTWVRGAMKIMVGSNKRISGEYSSFQFVASGQACWFIFWELSEVSEIYFWCLRLSSHLNENKCRTQCIVGHTSAIWCRKG